MHHPGTDRISAGTISDRTRRLANALFRRQGAVFTLPLTLALVSASSARGRNEKEGHEERDAHSQTNAAGVVAKAGETLALLAGDKVVARHVISEAEAAEGKVRIALKAVKGGEGPRLEAALGDEGEDAGGEEALAAAEGESGSSGAAAVLDNASDAGSGAVTGANDGEAASGASQASENDDDRPIWLIFGLGAGGAVLALAHHHHHGHRGTGGDDQEPPPPPPPQSELSGQVIKGYVQGAAVYLDIDHDGLPDGDPVYTDALGRFTFQTNETGASLLVYGGVDTLTNSPLDGLILRAPPGSTVVTPLTTLIDEMMKQEEGLSASEAQDRLAQVLGLTLPDGVDLLTFDSIENIDGDGAAVEDQAEIVLNTISAIQSLLVGSGAAEAVDAANAAIGAIAASVLAQDGALDLTSAEGVQAVLETAFEGTGVGASNPDDLTNLAAAIAAVNASLQEASGLGDEALQATRYALSGFQDLLVSIGANAHQSEAFERDISFGSNSELAEAVESLASGGVSDAIDSGKGASISYALRLEGSRFVFALNPELKLYEGAPDKIDTVTVKFDVEGVIVERELRGANGEITTEVLSPDADGRYTLQYAELDKIFIRPPEQFNGRLGADVSVHYVGLDVTTSSALSIEVTAVNDAPVAHENSITVAEDTERSFSGEDFGFEDVEGDDLKSLIITSLPERGTLYFGETALTGEDLGEDGYVIDASDIGLLKYVPGEDYNGEDSFGYRLQDTGGTANGGQDTSEVATFTIDVTPVNDAPVAQAASAAVREGGEYGFKLEDFPFEDVEGDSLQSLIITSLPEHGTLYVGETALTGEDLGEDGYVIDASDLGLLKYVPSEDYRGEDSFGYRLRDDGGTDNEGKDLSEVATFDLSVTPINHAPAATDNTVKAFEDKRYTFSTSDFTYEDDEDHDLSAVIITSLPEHGTLFLDDVPLCGEDLGEDGYRIDAADLAAGKLVFKPDANFEGRVSFEYKVQDAGGTEDGGKDTSAQSATLTIKVRPVNDAPEMSLPDYGHGLSPQLAGEPFQVNTFTPGEQERPSIAALPDGGFVIVWMSHGQEGEDDGYGIFGQRFDASGEKVGEEFQINEVVANDQFEPMVVALPDGNFMVLWSSLTEVEGEDVRASVRMRVFDSQCVPLGCEEVVAEGAFDHFSAHAAAGSQGVVVVWTADNLDGSGYGVYARVPGVDDPIRVNTTTMFDQKEPKVAALADGTFVVTWTGRDGGNSLGVFAQRIGADGTFIGGEVRVNECTEGDQHKPSIAALSDGGYVISWTSEGDSGPGVYVQRFDASGEPVGEAILVSTHSIIDPFGSAVVAVPTGGFVVTWASWGAESTLDVFAQRFGVDGEKLGEPIVVNTTTEYEQNAPAVAVLEDGSLIVTWQSYGEDGSETGIYAQRFAPLAPVFIEHGPAVLIAPNATVSDLELGALQDGEGNWSGAKLTIGRKHGANAEDEFGFQDGEGYCLTEDGRLLKDGEQIALFSQEGGRLVITFGAGDENVDGPTTADVNYILQHITYRNTSDNPGERVELQFRIDDGNGWYGDQGIGRGIDKGTVEVNLIGVNDAPEASGGTVSVKEDGERHFDVSKFGFSDVEGDELQSVIITSLPEHGTLYVGETALTGEDLGEDGYVIDASDIGLLKYVPGENYNGEDSFGYRLQDTGGTAHGGEDTSAEATMSITVKAVNDAPVLDLEAASVRTLTVTTLDDFVGEDGELSLREALELAEDGDRIVIDPSLYEAGVARIDLTSTLEITKQVYIDGGAEGQQLQLYGDGTFQVVYVTNDVGDSLGGAVLEDVLIGGKPDSEFKYSGASAMPVGVHNAGTLTLANVVIADHTVTAEPLLFVTGTVGALINDATLYLSGVTIRDISVTASSYSLADRESGSAYAVVNNGAIHAVDVSIEAVNLYGGSPAGNGVGGNAYVVWNNGEIEGTIGIEGSNSIVAGTGPQGDGGSGFVLGNEPTGSTEFTYQPPSVDGAVSYTEDGPAVRIAPNATVTDVELDERDNWSGAKLTIGRKHGANAEDEFGFQDGEGYCLTEDGRLLKDGEQIALFSQEGGRLVITFGAGDENVDGPTTADVNYILQHITYRNTSDNPGERVELQFRIDDGNGWYGDQGIGRGIDKGTVEVNLIGVNDAPTLTNPDRIVTLNEDQGYSFSLSDFDFTDVEGHGLGAVIIESLPDNGTLLYDGEAVTAPGFEVSGEDLASGKLSFQPNENYYGSTSFEYRVRDTGGTINGGEDTSAAAMFTFDMRSVNDAPVLEIGSSSGARVWTVTDLGDYLPMSSDPIIEGSLRWVLGEAEDGDIIVIDPSLYDDNGIAKINLQSTLTIDKEIFIDGGDDDNKLELHGDGSFYVLFVTTDTKNSEQGVILEDVRITGATDADKSSDLIPPMAVYNWGKLTLAYSSIESHHIRIAESSSADAVGIKNESGAFLNLYDVVIRDIELEGASGSGTATYGYLIHNTGDIQAYDVALEGITVRGGSWGSLTNPGVVIHNGGSINGISVPDVMPEDIQAEIFLSGEAVVPTTDFVYAPPEVTAGVSYTVDGPAVLLAPNATVMDVELDALNGGQGNWSGATITVRRQGGASAEDVFGHQDSGDPEAALVWNDEAGTITKNGAVIARFTNADGELQIRFTGSGSGIPTTEDVNSLLRQITYSNSSPLPAEQVVIEYVVSDGNASFNGAQGSGGAGITTETVTVNIDVPAYGVPSVALLGESDSATVGDGITNAIQPTFRVTLPDELAEGLIVQLFLKGGEAPFATHTLTADDIEQGWVDVPLPETAEDGEYAVVARLAGQDGTTGTEFSAPYYVVVDTAAPDAPVLDFTELALRADAADSFVVSGTAEPLSRVTLELSIDGEGPVEFHGTADANGRFHVPVSIETPAPDTVVSVVAWATDRAGNRSADSEVSTLTITEAAAAVDLQGGEDDEVVVSNDEASVFHPKDGFDYHFIGGADGFHTIHVDGASFQYTITLVEGEARDQQAVIVDLQGGMLEEDRPLYLIEKNTGGRIWAQADRVVFSDGIVHLTHEGAMIVDRASIVDDGPGNDYIVGSSLASDDGDDVLVGGAGEDQLLSSAGNDVLIGGDGDDWLYVLGDRASGEDSTVHLYGGDGADSFVIMPQAGFDRHVTIHDFVIGQDKLDLTALFVEDGDGYRALTLEDLDLEAWSSQLQENGAMAIDLSDFFVWDWSDSRYHAISGMLEVHLAGGMSTLDENSFVWAMPG